MSLPGSARKRLRARREALAAGEACEVPCRLRRTSSRGWGPWVGGVLQLPGEDGPAVFVADDPLQASFVSGRAGHPAPAKVAGPGTLSRRPVRFKGEDFFGSDAEFLVVVTDRHRTEIATDPPDTDGVAARLVTRAGLAGGAG